ncbi:hypothetical protein GH5_00175 [Leishmania sp. Ghana 2012 LV757]|uniref:hypothetical protein n=1 Tax=Leishmania sp. Ghana 2012 LV757 TaxID=2803181 RepID=UPI001B53CBD6|nr:hypothetical protein GH5_00175 [Leishmania sp. Ghana 2012 LV757]
MAHTVPSCYMGESVRSTVHRLFGARSDAPLTVLHATVPPVAASLLQERANLLDTILDCIRDQLYPENSTIVANAATGSCAATNHWLRSVPESLRCDEAAVVNYLGMMVAIDFCHWAEVPRDADRRTTAKIGEKVTGFAGFYAAVEPPSGDAVLANASAPSSAPIAELFTESSRTAPNDVGSPPAATVATGALLRGSAAMMYLLRRAVEVHQLPWFDPEFLQRFRGDTEAAMGALRVCFLGCEKDGVTPLWMPCSRERVELLLSLADAFVARRTSYYALLRECGGFIFVPHTAMNATAPCGLVPALVRFHPRYRDFVRVPAEALGCMGVNAGEDAGGVCVVPVLKLDQLTALAFEQALPELWRSQATSSASSKPQVCTAPPSAPPDSWLTDQAALIVSYSAAFRTAEQQRALSGVFADRAKLSICCDYQIPKTLRAAGLLVYDDHLARMVDEHVLLLPGSAEEVSIRVAALIAAERLLEFLNTPLQQRSLLPRGDRAAGAESPEAPKRLPANRPCDAIHLDFALWHVGRYMLPSEARHHLCRTIMY